jgi:hypothetical protein
MLVEDKDDVRKRIGRSPDNADTAVMALDLARCRMQLHLAEMGGGMPRERAAPIHDVDNSAEFCKDDWQPEDEPVMNESEV